MAPVQNARLIFNEPITEGFPVIGKTLVTDKSVLIDPENVPLKGGIVAKTLCFSIDPYMRSMLDAKGPYSDEFKWKVGKPIWAWSVARVLRSEDPAYEPGDVVTSQFELAEYVVFLAKDRADLRKLPKDTGLRWSVFTGVAGMPGRSAYYGWREVANAKKGETIYVSTAAGPVGSVVVQLAKREGLKVIASAGSEAKLQFLREIGADVVFNYKTVELDDVLKEHGPVDIYWDHVGNQALETVLEHANHFARIVSIGAVASYNAPVHPIKNITHVLYKEITLRGLLITSWEWKYIEEFYEKVVPLIAAGEIKYTESAVHSMDDAAQLLDDVLHGKNYGKAVVVLGDE